jgi:hypothetical protein
VVKKSSIFLLSPWQAQESSSQLPLSVAELDFKRHFTLVLGKLSFLTEEGGQGLIFVWFVIFSST